jgi:TolA-binding protein
MVDVKHLLLPVLLLACAVPGATGVAVPTPAAEAKDPGTSQHEKAPGPKTSRAQSADAEIEALARQAMGSSDPKVQAETLKRLRDHHFQSSRAPERESALFVQGLMEDRQGNQAQAAAALRKLEQFFPRSAYLPEANVILADAALGRRRLHEAESRLRKALGAEMPGEARRRGQELLLWCLAEQGRAKEGAAVLQVMGPLEDGQPNERGLVGIMATQCATLDKDAAAATLRAYQRKFPKGAYGPRMDLGWAKLLGATGAARESAVAFRGLIQSAPGAPEADEARLALASLLADGRLPAGEAAGFPSAQSLLAGLKKGSLKESQTREALLVKARLATGERKWTDVIATLGQLRGQHPLPQELEQARDLRAGALRQWTREQVDRGQTAPLLPYLDGEGVPSLTPELRLALAKCLAKNGLPEAARAIVPLAPAGERAVLLKAALDGTTAAGNPEGALDLLPGKGETARQSLARAQAELALHKWPEARTALARAQAGPERIQALVAYLNRPAGTAEPAASRRREAESWLARAPEKGPDREPLTILAADLRVREADWKGALALYPAAPLPGNRGWVALMRATCQARLGQKEPARATLKAAADDKSFQTERRALEQRLAM